MSAAAACPRCAGPRLLGFLLACFLGSAAGHIVSPVLGKCLDIEAKLKPNGERETLEEMKAKEEPINVQLYKCHAKHNQQWDIVDGTLKSSSLGFCLEAEHVEDNKNIQVAECEKTNRKQKWRSNNKQKWELTSYNYVKSLGSEKCMDVEAALKDDGTREKFDEIKQHKVVNVHLYQCHDQKTTKRVNQLWSWEPVKGDEIVSDKFEDIGRIKTSASSYGTIALAAVGAVCLFVVSVFVALRVHRSPLRQPTTVLIE